MRRHITFVVGLTALLLLLIPACQSSVSPNNSVNDVYVHGRAAWSPDSKLIAFTSFAQNTPGIYVMDTLGKNIRLVASGSGVGVSWSPDGNWLVFSQGGTLYKVKPSGDSLVSISDITGAIRPTWSTDGSKIAFVQGAPGSGVWIYDVVKATSSQLLTYGDFPSWDAATGELVLLSAGVDLNTGLGVFTLFAVNITTNAQRTLDLFYTASDCGFSSINRQGTALAYSIKRPDDFVQIYKTDLILGTRTQLTTDGGDYAAWSPDGTKIVFTRTQTGDGGLWVMNADGTNKLRLTQP